MRRIVIVVIGLAVIGIAIYLFSPSRKRSLEWHKQQYADAVFNRNKGVFGEVRWPFARAAAAVGQTNIIGTRHQQRIERCQEALMKLGYLERRTFVLTNQSAAKVMSRLARTKVFKEGMSPGHISVSPAMSMVFDWEGHEVMLGVALQPEDSTRLVLIAPPRDFDLWEELCRKADMPNALD